MSRPVVWHRNTFAALVSNTIQLAGLTLSPVPAGSTIVRVRWTIEVSRFGVPNPVLLPIGMVTYGVILTEASELGTTPYPLAHPEAEWMWWETVHLHPVDYQGSGTTEWFSQGPEGDKERSSEAQRVCLEDDPTLYFSAQADGVNETSFTMRGGVSVLVALPA